jgi:hypothetical protein
LDVPKAIGWLEKERKAKALFLNRNLAVDICESLLYHCFIKQTDVCGWQGQNLKQPPLLTIRAFFLWSSHIYPFFSTKYGCAKLIRFFAELAARRSA